MKFFLLVSIFVGHFYSPLDPDSDPGALLNPDPESESTTLLYRIVWCASIAKKADV